LIHLLKNIGAGIAIIFVLVLASICFLLIPASLMLLIWVAYALGDYLSPIIGNWSGLVTGLILIVTIGGLLGIIIHLATRKHSTTKPLNVH
jgi:hypothetical protein